MRQTIDQVLLQEHEICVEATGRNAVVGSRYSVGPAFDGLAFHTIYRLIR